MQEFAAFGPQHGYTGPTDKTKKGDDDDQADDPLRPLRPVHPRHRRVWPHRQLGITARKETTMFKLTSMIKLTIRYARYIFPALATVRFSLRDN